MNCPRISKKKSPKPIIDMDAMESLVAACFTLALVQIVSRWHLEVLEEQRLRRMDPDYRIDVEIRDARYKPVKEDNSGEC